MGLTPAQNRLIHSAARNLGLDREAYGDVLFSAAGVRSSKDLTPAGFDAALRRFEELGWKNPVPHPKPRRRRSPEVQHAAPLGDTVSGRQQAKMQHLYSELGMETEARQIGFNRRQCGKPWPQTRRDANRVIEGLKKMAGRGYDAGPDRHP